VQCLTDWLYPEMGVDIVDVLRGLGARVVFPEQQHCCGLPALDSGALEQGKQMARQTIQTLEGCPADYIVSGGTSCVIAVLHEYGHLFADEPGWQVRARRQAERVLDFTSFMHRVARLPERSLAAAGGEAAAYHYFCQSYNVLGFREEPLRLLVAVCGLDVQPLPEANVCCGFGGSVSFNRPEMCAHILERKLDNLDTAGVPLLITDNPGCIMHLRGGIAASGRKVEVKHTAQVVAERLRAVQRRA
jgi:Fe-S oxidoreductase